MSRSELFAHAAAELSAAGIGNPRLEARLLLEFVEEASNRHPSWPAPEPATHPASVASERVMAHGRSPMGGRVKPGHDVELPEHLEQLLARRVAREPLAYILGRKEFWSLDFEVGPGALVPRPETETLIEAALEAFPERAAPLRILDLGCGSGCLIVTALTLYPKAAGTGLDISSAALDWTRRNAVKHGVADRLALLQGGWEIAEGEFDLILCNPPYLSAADMAAIAPELHYEPAGALESGASGLEAYELLAARIPRLLAPEGVAIFELGAGQAPAVSELFRREPLEILRIKPDLSGIPRALTVCLSARAKKLLEVAGQAVSFPHRGEAETPARTEGSQGLGPVGRGGGRVPRAPISAQSERRARTRSSLYAAISYTRLRGADEM